MRRVLAGAIAVLAASVLAAPVTAHNPWGRDYFPNVPVLTQDGKTLRFYDDVIQGRVVVISFVYTSCSDLCPVETARLAEVKERLGDAVGRDVFLVSMSVDPEHDTPALLKAFADAFDANAPGWLFLTGRPEDIRSINAKFGDRSGERTLNDHRNEILIGNVATGDWERDSAFADIDRIVTTVRSMDAKLRDRAAPAPVEVAAPLAGAASDPGLYPISAQPGQAMFKKMCAPCHTIGGGAHVGPDLRGVAERRDRGWLVDFIRNPARMLASNDPQAVALAARFPVRMPVMGLGETDAADVIAYVKAETSRLMPR